MYNRIIQAVSGKFRLQVACSINVQTCFKSDSDNLNKETQYVLQKQNFKIVCKYANYKFISILTYTVQLM